MKHPMIIAHRGASGYEPENTLRAFKRALEMGTDAIELDVHQAKSGELIVIHDDTVDRTTQCSGAVAQLTYKELKACQTPEGEHIPELGQVLDLINKECILNIELKGAQTAQPVAQLILHYIERKGWSPELFIVTSFDYEAVSEFHSHAPSVRTGVIFERNLTGCAQIIQQAEATIAVIPYQSATQELVEDLHEQNIEVFVYTVNNKSIAQRLAKLHVDAICSDYPDILD